MDFDCIYKSYYLDVYHFLCGLSSNKEIAEDITQETFTKALTAYGTSQRPALRSKTAEMRS